MRARGRGRCHRGRVMVRARGGLGSRDGRTLVGEPLRHGVPDTCAKAGLKSG